jgi:hypothetical protein
VALVEGVELAGGVLDPPEGGVTETTHFPALRDHPW